jgi:predicted DNA-binding protein (MmcQ/YjbR family)
MNKTHWNSVLVGELPDKLVKELIRHSYELVKSSLPKKIQAEIALGN